MAYLFFNITAKRNLKKGQMNNWRGLCLKGRRNKQLRHCLESSIHDVQPETWLVNY